MAGPKKAQNGAAWAKALRGVLNRAAGKEQARAGNRIARELERLFGERHERAVVTRWLRGERTPDQQGVARMNAAVGALVGGESARRYLDAEARACGLLEVDEQTALHDGLAPFEFVIYPEPPPWSETGVPRAIAALPAEKRRRLLAELHRVHRHLLYDAIGASVPYERGVESIQACFAKHGLNLDELLDGERFGTAEQLAITAELRDALARAFATFFPDSAARERFGAAHAIGSAYRRYIARLPASKILDFQGPSFFFRLWQAYQAKEKLRLPSAPQAALGKRCSAKRPAKKQKGESKR